MLNDFYIYHFIFINRYLIFNQFNIYIKLLTMTKRIKQTTTLIISFISLLLMFSACKKDSSKDFVTDYNPDLTSEKGTIFTGDYFPIGENYSWELYGTTNMNGYIKYSGGGESDKEDIDESESDYINIYIGAKENINIDGVIKSLYPLYDESDYIRYLDKTSEGVFIIAVKDYYGNIMTVTNPVFIRNPLIVGDKWKTEPAIDMNMIMSEMPFDGDVTTDLNSMIYVIGAETKTIDSSPIETIRLDQLAEAKIKMTVNDNNEGYTLKGSMTIVMKLKNKINLAEDIGTVYQDSEYDITGSGSFSMAGQSFSVSMEINADGIYTLDYYFIGSNNNIESPQLKSAKVPDKTYSKNNAVDNIMKGAIKISEIIKKQIKL